MRSDGFSLHVGEGLGMDFDWFVTLSAYRLRRRHCTANFRFSALKVWVGGEAGEMIRIWIVRISISLRLPCCLLEANFRFSAPKIWDDEEAWE